MSVPMAQDPFQQQAGEPAFMSKVKEQFPQAATPVFGQQQTPVFGPPASFGTTPTGFMFGQQQMVDSLKKQLEERDARIEGLCATIDCLRKDCEHTYNQLNDARNLLDRTRNTLNEVYDKYTEVRTQLLDAQCGYS